MNNILNDFLSGNVYEMLEYIHKNNPEYFLEEIKKQHDNNNSFFRMTINKAKNPEEAIKIYDFIVSIGYDIKEDVGFTIKSEKFPQYISVSGWCNNQLMTHIAKSVDINYLKKLSENHDIVKSAFKSVNTDLIRYYQEIGLDLKLDGQEYGSNYVIAKNSPELLSLYWELTKNKSNSSITPNKKEFEEDIKWIFEKTSQVYTKADYGLDNVRKYIDLKWDTYSDLQKEEVIKNTAHCLNPALTTHVLKKHNTSFGKYNSKLHPIWENIASFQNKINFYRVTNSLSLKEYANDKYSVVEFINFYSNNRTHKVTANKLDSVLLEKINTEFLLSPVENKDCNYFTYLTVVETNNLDLTYKYFDKIEPLYSSLINNNFDREIVFTQEEKQQIQHYMDNTWLKEFRGQMNLSQYIIHNGDKLSSWILSKPLLENNVYSSIQLETVLNAFYLSDSVNFIRYDKTTNGIIKGLYEHMRSRNDINWDNIYIPNSKKDMELSYEIKVLQEYNKMNKSIPLKDEVVKKLKL